MFEIIDKNSNDFHVIRNNKNILKPIALHDMILSKYALILGYYPMINKKYDVFISLDRYKRVGMLSRHILGVASKLGVYQVVLKEINSLKDTHRNCKKYLKQEKKNSNNLFTAFKQEKQDPFWQKRYEENKRELSKSYIMLLDMILEEINKRNNPKYLRKKKLQEIKSNLQN